MLLDSQNLFSDKQKITTGTIYSTNTVKFGEGDISYLPLIIQAVSDFSDLTSLAVQVQTSSSADFTTSTTLTSATMTKAELKAGAKFPISYLPKGNLGYVRLAYIVTGTSETTGTITAGVVASDDITL